MKKGTEVFRIADWDNKGTFYVMRCVVDSWGKKQIHLREIGGEMTKHREYAASVAGYRYENDGMTRCGGPLIIAASEGLEVAEAHALRMAAESNAWRINGAQRSIRAAYEDTAARFDARWVDRRRNEIQNEIHEPRVHWYKGARS
jgi:hypothetical protein